MVPLLPRSHVTTTSEMCMQDTVLYKVIIIRAFRSLPFHYHRMISPRAPPPVQEPQRVYHATGSPHRVTFGNSARSLNILSPQLRSFRSCTSFTSFPWLKLSRIAAFTSPAVFIRCAGDSKSVIADGADDDESNASSAIVLSSSARNSGLSSPRGANSS